MLASNRTFVTKSRPYQYRTRIVFGGAVFCADEIDCGHSTNSQPRDKNISFSIRFGVHLDLRLDIDFTSQKKSFKANCNCLDEPDSPVGNRVAVIRPKLALPVTFPGWPK